MGAWISYGLGTENSNLPSFITINPTLGHGGVQNFGSAFLPAQHQATRIGRSGGKETGEGSIANLDNSYLSRREQREQLELTQMFNRHQLERSSEDKQLAARIESLVYDATDAEQAGHVLYFQAVIVLNILAALGVAIWRATRPVEPADRPLFAADAADA